MGAGQGFYGGIGLGTIGGILYVKGDFQGMAGLAVVFGAGIGALSGAIIGGIIGSPMVFVVEEPFRKPPTNEKSNSAQKLHNQ